MTQVFADTAYWVALVAPRDELHERAKQVSASLSDLQIVTSEWVLTELLNGFAEARPDLRVAACRAVASIRTRADMILVQQTSSSFAAAFDLYCERPDKGWSLTDCASFLIMRQFGILGALTSDRHFEQAGFEALLR